MKLIGSVFVLLALVACSATNKMIVADYDIRIEKQLPTITVFLKRPTDDFRERCLNFDNASVLNHCQLNQLNLSKFATELKQSGLFEDVEYANKDIGYRLLVTTGTYNAEGGEDIGNALIAGATMMLAPIVVSTDIKVDAVLFWYGYELKRFQYELPFEERRSILTMGQDTERDIAKSIASHILRDIQSKKLFTANYLSKTIKSSDYENTLKAPKEMGNFFRQATVIYNHPFGGARMRYSRETSLSGHVDVFVYPIRSAFWQNEMDILGKEVANIKKDIEWVNTENETKTLRMDDHEPITVSSTKGDINAVMFESEFLDSLSNEYLSQTYLMIMKDKFVKVRHTALKGGPSRKDINTFVNQLVDQITVPEESLFMARLRKNWRDAKPM